jgi:hypothetical protein
MGRLLEVYNDMNNREFWRNVEVSYMSGEVSIDGKLKSLLSDADTLVFDKFGIKPSDKVYFIAGSARLHLEPRLTKTFNVRGPVGDLDIVIPDERFWQRAIKKGTLDKSEVGYDEQRGYVYRPKGNKDIEVFSKWDPSLAGVEYQDVNVRSNDEILSDSVERGGYHFMNIGDVIDYKLKLDRDKEKGITDLIKRYLESEDTEENIEVFFKKLGDMMSQKEIDVLRKNIVKESDFDWVEDVGYTEEEEFIINLIDSCEKEPFKNGLLCTKDDERYFYLDKKGKRFYFTSDSVYADLKSKFGLNLQEMRVLVENILERHFKLRGYTVIWNKFYLPYIFERHYKK